MKMSGSLHTLKLLALAVTLSTTALVADAQERTRTPTDATGAATTESTRGVANGNGNQDQAQQNANATKALGANAGANAMQTDGQILQIIKSLNDAEIKQAELVEDSENEQVKATSESIINDHEMANEKIDDLVDGELSLDDSPLNDTLAKQAETTYEMLDELEDTQLDCQYLQKQVEQHQLALDTVKNDLTPDAKNAGVKAFLTETAPKLEHHLQAAQNAMKGVSGCAQTASTQSNQTQSNQNRNSTQSTGAGAGAAGDRE